MDMSKIFLKNACPTSVGGQAVLEGVMMRGMAKTAISVRLPDGRIYTKTTPNTASHRWTKIPLLRGVVSFVISLVEGTKTLTWSADVAEYFMTEEEAEREPEDGKGKDGECPDASGAPPSVGEGPNVGGEARSTEEPGRLETWLVEKFGSNAVWNAMIFLSVAIALVFSIGIFVLLPTAVIGWLKPWISNAIVLNLIEGVLRILMFIVYIVLIARMEDIQRVFQYHGAEHKTIHCFENNLELNPANAQQFYTLHPRCGTSFLMFVMVVSLILFSLLGWPNLLWRIVSRLLLLPVVAGLSYELLRWAGRSDTWLVRMLSIPGLYLQKLTTRPPEDDMIEVAIVSLKGALSDPDAPSVEGIADLDGTILEPMNLEELKAEREKQEKGA